MRNDIRAVQRVSGLNADLLTRNPGDFVGIGDDFVGIGDIAQVIAI